MAMLNNQTVCKMISGTMAIMGNIYEHFRWPTKTYKNDGWSSESCDVEHVFMRISSGGGHHVLDKPGNWFPRILGSVLWIGGLANLWSLDFKSKLVHG